MKFENYRWFNKKNRTNAYISIIAGLTVLLVGAGITWKIISIYSDAPYPSNVIAEMVALIIFIAFWMLSEVFDSDYETEDRIERIEKKLRLKVYD